MLASLLIVFREVVEAGLIVGIVMAATEGIAMRSRWIAGGIACGLAGAIVLAVFAGRLESAFDGNGHDLFNAAVLVVAVLMLGWHNLWMASHGRAMAQEMSALGRDVAAGRRSLMAMAVVVAIAVLREGGEIVLFLYGIAISARAGLAGMMVGGALGVAGGAGLSTLLYHGLLRIPLRRLFSVTSWLVALLAAGMAGQAASLLARDGLIPAWGYQLWDTSWLLPDGGLPGRAAAALVGYSARPEGVQLAAWLLTLAILVAGAHLAGRSARPARASAPARAPVRGG